MPVVLSDLSFSWPNGRGILSDLSVAFGPGRTGLIGMNGSGKSTLLRLIAGELPPTSGSVTVTGDVGYLPQDRTLDTEVTVAELLGIASVRDAIRAIESGSTSAAPFDTVGDDWDIEDRAREWLSRLGLAHVGLDDRVRRLSGGETAMTALAGLFARNPSVILLDEPTNNLDLDARRRLAATVNDWPGVMLVVSHDRALLETMDQIADLSQGSLRMYGGNLSAYQAQLAAEQAAAEQAVTAAAADVRREKHDLVSNETKQAKRERAGRQLSASGSLPHAAAGGRKRSAQETAGRSRELHTARLTTAKSRLAEAKEAVRDDDTIRISLPGTAVPAGRTVLTVRGLDRPWHPVLAASPEPKASPEPEVSQAAEQSGQDQPAALAVLDIRGPERIALTGPNGAGKTTLLRAMAGVAALDGVTVRRSGAIGYLPQRLDVLDNQLTVAENVRAAAPAASVNEVRAGLARFLFRGTRADQVTGSLSGGERFRAVLAALLLAQPPPQLLLLDEPTNSLDMASARQLAQALSCYRGAVLVASHDVPFLRSIGITRWLRLEAGARLLTGGPL
jgi:ATPase subunit of ABC transporter with duplicated ATPase domains